MAAQSVPVLLETPRLTIPDVGSVETEKGTVEFSIPTASGSIMVTSWGWRYWTCRGTADALADYGLLRGLWLPGLPGNGKTRQTVLFTPQGPQLRLGRRGGARLPDNRITIVRVSSQTYEVEVPMTAEQAARVEQVWTRHSEREKQARRDAQEQEEIRAKMEMDAKYRAWSMQLTPMELRLRMKGQIDMSQELLFDWFANTRFRFSSDTEKAIRDCYARLQHLVASGPMRREPSEHDRSNVVQLRF